MFSVTLLPVEGVLAMRNTFTLKFCVIEWHCALKQTKDFCDHVALYKDSRNHLHPAVKNACSYKLRVSLANAKLVRMFSIQVPKRKSPSPALGF
jgi:uncharacterized protein (UPF0262 family)